MKYLFALLFFLPNLAFSETWICQQSFPQLGSDYLYKFERNGDGFIWVTADKKIVGPDNKYSILFEDEDFIIMYDGRYLSTGSMWAVIFDKKNKTWVMNHNSKDYPDNDPNTKWSGNCEVVR